MKARSTVLALSTTLTGLLLASLAGAADPTISAEAAEAFAPPAPLGVPIILYDQTANQTTNGFSSQDFVNPGNDGFDSFSADDFVVPAGFLWSIEQLQIPGFFGGGAPGPVLDVDVTFFADAAGLPGTAECSYLDVVPAAQASGSLTIDLPSPCSLLGGTYWMMVQSRAEFATNGQWFWFTESVATGNQFVWQNPNDGFASGCTTWTTATSCGASNPDSSFVILGSEGPAPVNEIPTVGTWGLVALLLLLGVTGLLVLRRRDAMSPAA